MKLRHIINSGIWWFAGTCFTFGLVVFSPAMLADPQFGGVQKILLSAFLSLAWPMVLGGYVVGVVP